MKAKLDELDKKIEDLKAKAEKASGEEKIKLEQKWKDSAGKRAELAKKYEELKSAAADKWQDVKKETEHAYEELKKEVNK
jgi:archaellum component FlaC